MAVTAATRRTLQRGVVRPGWVALALLLGTTPLLGDLPTAYRYAPLVASAVVLGLPHGAVDHLALDRVRSRSPTPRSVGRVGLLYLLVGGAYAACWFLAPTAAFVLFVALTWVHWGQGDLHALVRLGGASHLRTRGQRALTVAVRGGLPMLVPLVAFPGRYRAVGQALVGLFGPGSLGGVGWLFAPSTRLAVGAGFALLTAGTLALHARRAADPGDWVLDAGETLLLWLFFLLVPPVLAVGWYFCLWHALRHVGRLALVDDGAATALAGGDLSLALGRVARDAAPLTAASLLLLGGWYLLVPASPTDVPGLVAVYLVLVAVLTAPHVVVVTLMDRAEGVWTPQSAPSS